MIRLPSKVNQVSCRNLALLMVYEAIYRPFDPTGFKNIRRKYSWCNKFSNQHGDFWTKLHRFIGKQRADIATLQSLSGLALLVAVREWHEPCIFGGTKGKTGGVVLCHQDFLFKVFQKILRPRGLEPEIVLMSFFFEMQEVLLIQSEDS